MLTHEDKVLFEKAENFYQEGKYSEALMNYNDVLLNFSADGTIFYGIAKTYFKLGQPKIAIANFEKACKLLTEAPKYQARKEFAAMLSEDQFHKEASQYYLPAASKAKTEEDLITGIQYLLKVEDIDSSEQLLAKHIHRFPDAFNQAMKVSNVETFALERLKNRKRSILKALKNNFQPTLDSANDELDFLEKNSERDTYNQLITNWERATEDFDYAESVETIVTAKNKLAEFAKKITTEKIALEKEIEKREIAELKLGHLKQVSQLNELDMELNSILPKLPETSLKIDIPPFLNVVKDFKAQILRNDYTVVRRAYLNLGNLIAQGNFLKSEAQKTIERMLKPSELETAIVAANTQIVAQKSKKPAKTKKAKRTEEDYIILDSQTGKRKKRRGLPLFWVFLGLVVVGGLATFFMMDGFGKEKRVLITNVFMRQYADINSSKVREKSYQEGESFQVLAEEGNWLKIKAADGNIGYMLSEYYATPAEYTFIQGIFADQETKELFTSARHKITLLNYFKKNNWIGDISDQVEKEIYGDISSREIRQVHGLEQKSRFNVTVIMDLTPYEKYDLVCLIRGESDEHLIIYAYEDDNTPVEIYTKTIPGTNHLLRGILDKNDNGRNWYLGKRDMGQKVTGRLVSNALLVQIDQSCDHLYVYERSYVEEYPQLNCD